MIRQRSTGIFPHRRRIRRFKIFRTRPGSAGQTDARSVRTARCKGTAASGMIPIFRHFYSGCKRRRECQKVCPGFLGGTGQRSVLESARAWLRKCPGCLRCCRWMRRSFWNFSKDRPEQARGFMARCLPSCAAHTRRPPRTECGRIS